MQAVFELGILAYEVCCRGKHPLKGYPGSHAEGWSTESLPPLPPTYPAEFRDLLPRMIAWDTAERVSLEDAMDVLRRLRREAKVPPAHALPCHRQPLRLTEEEVCVCMAWLWGSGAMLR